MFKSGIDPGTNKFVINAITLDLLLSVIIKLSGHLLSKYIYGYWWSVKNIIILEILSLYLEDNSIIIILF